MSKIEYIDLHQWKFMGAQVNSWFGTFESLKLTNEKKGNI